MSSEDSTDGKRDMHEKAIGVSAETHGNALRAEAHSMTKKEALSTYFTIAAAAFGLISDGCKRVFDSSTQSKLISLRQIRTIL
jgi:hypothetical protein